MDLIETNVAIDPDEFARVDRADNKEKQERRSLQNLNHQVGDRPDVDIVLLAGEVAAQKRVYHHDEDDRPENDGARNPGKSQPSQRPKLCASGCGIEDLRDIRKTDAEPRASLLLRFFIGSRFLRAATGAPSRQQFGRHREHRKCHDECRKPNAEPEQPVGQENPAPMYEQCISLCHRPIARHALNEIDAEWIENRGPRAIELIRRRDRNKQNQVDGEKRDSLQIHDDDSPRKRRNAKV